MIHWLALALFLVWSGASLAGGMNGPHPIYSPQAQAEPGSPAWGGQRAVRFFQTLISPADGPRSPSYPTGSAYGMQVLAEDGLFFGILMIGDRLFHEADRPLGPIVHIYGRDRFYDPPAYNRYWRD